MKPSFNFRAGLAMAFATLIVGVGFFVMVGGRMDMKCAVDAGASGCRVWAAADAAISNYTDIFRTVFVSRCVGGDGPDDCIGADLLIMGGTLAVLGFLAGGWLFRSSMQPSPDVFTPGNKKKPRV